MKSLTHSTNTSSFLYFNSPEAHSVDIEAQETKEKQQNLSISNTVYKNRNNPKHMVYALEESLNNATQKHQNDRRNIKNKYEKYLNKINTLPPQFETSVVNDVFETTLESKGVKITREEKEDKNGEKYININMEEDFSNEVGAIIKRKISNIKEYTFTVDGQTNTEIRISQYIKTKDKYYSGYGTLGPFGDAVFKWNNNPSKSELEKIGVNTSESIENSIVNMSNSIATNADRIQEDVAIDNSKYQSASKDIITNYYIAKEAEEREKANKLIEEFQNSDEK